METIAVYIETYGCQMNKLDSEHIHAVLREEGFAVVEDMTKADVILLNTCAVRDNAEQRIHGRIGELFSLKKNRPGLFFGVVGCMAQRLGEELLSKDVRVIAGPDTYRRLPGLIRRAEREGIFDIELAATEMYDDIAPVRTSRFSSWVSVTRGCNNFCSYCIVPYTRGRERSIPSAHVIAEIETLVRDRYREVTLLGQNVNSYNDGEMDFAGLLRSISDTGIDWIRFMTSHPKDISDEILTVMAERNNVCPHLHLPLQSGSDTILKAMNRGYTFGHYMEIIRKARQLMPEISITTDLIFGFPGETLEDYSSTLSVIKDVRYDFAFLYRYSERTGTKACDFPDPVPENVRIDRLSHAIDIQNSITQEKNTERIGTIATVLVKDVSKDRKGWYGFSETGIPVVLYSPSYTIEIGSFARVLIESTTGASLIGTVVKDTVE